jgi:hypothetical protein
LAGHYDPANPDSGGGNSLPVGRDCTLPTAPRRFSREGEAPGDRRPLNGCDGGTKKLLASIRLTTIAPPEENADQTCPDLSGCKSAEWLDGEPTLGFGGAHAKHHCVIASLEEGAEKFARQIQFGFHCKGPARRIYET